MELLYWRHPKIGMRLQLSIKPGGSGLLRSNAQEIGTCIPSDAAEVVSVTVVAVSLVTINIATVPMLAVAGFEWPVPTHRTIFSIPDLKSKPEAQGLRRALAELKIAKMKQSVTHRIFVLSPAYAGGERARMILRDQAQFPLARTLRAKSGAPIADVFTFLSGLYFRGKIAYANAFARPARGMSGVLVITPTRGLIDARTRIRLDDLREFAEVDIHVDDARYRMPIERDVRSLAKKLSAETEVVLLGSIATGKYVEVLLANFGQRLRFPADFVGRGDMSRGGLMLRCAADLQELSYLPVAGAIVKGKRPPKLAPRTYAASTQP